MLWLILLFLRYRFVVENVRFDLIEYLGFIMSNNLLIIILLFVFFVFLLIF